jgi:hypothetical protein
VLEDSVHVAVVRRHDRDIGAAEEDAALVGNLEPGVIRSVVVFPQQRLDRG